MSFDPSKYICVDVETSGIQPEFALQPWRAPTDAWLSSIAYKHADKEKVILSPTKDDIRKMLSYALDNDLTLLAYNSVFDVAWLIAYGFDEEVHKLKHMDGLLLHKHLTNTPGHTIPHGLKAVVKDYFPEEAGYEEDIEFFTTDAAKLQLLAEYNLKDVQMTLRVTERIYNQMTPAQRNAAAIEAECIPLIAYANFAGLKVDVDAAQELKTKLEQQALSLLQELSPHGVTEKIVRSPAQLNTLLFEKWGLPKLKGESTDKEALHELAHQDPRAKQLRELREALNLKTKFVEALIESAEYNGDGTTHPSAIIFGTYTGRLTYTSTQGRGKDQRQTGFAIHQMKRGKEYRNLIKAPDGYTMVEYDCSGQEFRLQAVMSKDQNMLAQCQVGKDPHQYMADSIAPGTPRQMGKLANLSMAYKTSAARLKTVARVQYSIPMEIEEATKIHAAYQQAYPGMVKYWDAQVKKGKAAGFVDTLAGRRLHLNGDWNTDGWALGSSAINYPIQSCGADQKYLALAIIKPYLREIGARFSHDLHDGIYLLLKNETVDAALEQIKLLLDNLPYEQAWGFTPTIPLPWDCKAGKSWGAMEEIKFPADPQKSAGAGPDQETSPNLTALPAIVGGVTSERDLERSTAELAPKAGFVKSPIPKKSGLTADIIYLTPKGDGHAPPRQVGQGLSNAVGTDGLGDDRFSGNTGAQPDSVLRLGEGLLREHQGANSPRVAINPKTKSRVHHAQVPRPTAADAQTMGQRPGLMEMNISNEEYARAVYGDAFDNGWLATAGFDWAGGFAPSKVKHLPIETANYLSVASMVDGAPSREEEYFAAAHLFVLDDVGRATDVKGIKMDWDVCEMFAPPPNAIIETSEGNHQWHYWLSTPCTDRWTWSCLLDGIKKSPMWGPAGDGNGVCRYYRLPNGNAYKPGKKGFVTHLVKYEPDAQRYTVAELAEWFGIDISPDAVKRHREEMELAADGIRKRSVDRDADVSGDNVLALFKAAGLHIIDPRINRRGFITVECPWADEHTDGDNAAGYYPAGSGGFACFHSHCKGRGLPQLMDWFGQNVQDDAKAIAAADVGITPVPVDVEAKERFQEAEADRVGRWVYVKETNRFMDVATGAALSKEVFNQTSLSLAPAGASGGKAAAAIFLNTGGRVVDTIDYLPGGERIVKAQRNGRELEAFNTWTPSHVQPYDQAVSNDDADVAEWLDHVKFVIHNEVERQLFLDWAAFLLQQPSGKVNYALLFQSAQGIGKDLMLRPLVAAIGQSNVSNITTNDLQSDWTDWLQARLVIVEELPRFHKVDVYEGLKSRISAAQELIRVNQKNIPQYYIRNQQAWVLMTNHADALALDKDDRRFAVIASKAEPKAEEYYEAKGQAFTSGVFLAKLMRWLLDRDIRAFNPMKRPIMTEAKAAMIRLARDQAEEWFDGLFETGEPMAGRRLVSVTEISRLAARDDQKLNSRQIQKLLLDRGAVYIDKQVRSETLGDRIRPWAVTAGGILSELSCDELKPIFDEDAQKTVAWVFKHGQNVN